MNIIWVFLPPTLSFKDGFVRRWNQQSVALYRSRCNSPRWVKPSVLKIQYVRKTLQFKKGAEKSFFHASYHFFLQLYHGPDISTMTSWQVCRRACRHPQSSTVSYFANYTILNNFHRSSWSPCCRWQSLRSVCVQTFSPQMTERTWNTFGWEPEGRCSQCRLALTGRTQRDMTLCASLTDHLATGTQM